MALKYTTGSAEAGNRFLVPDGIYEVEVINAIEKTSKTSGQPMIELKVQVVGQNGDHGPKFFDWLVMSEGGAWKIDSFLVAAGKHPGEGVEIELEADDLIGVAVRARLKQRKKDNGTVMEVDAYLAPESETEFD
jgi:hypothetical protein